MCKDLGIKGNINSGYRSTERQKQLYIQAGGKLINGEWIGGKPTVAKPGGSWHEYHLALDTDTLKIKAINKVESTANQKILTKYGLFKPLTKGNGTSIQEDWHIQPIETLNIKDKKTIMPLGNVLVHSVLRKGDKGDDVKKVQEKLQSLGYPMEDIDGDFGEKTENAVKLFQKNKNLTVDGIVGKGTFEVLMI